MLVRLLALARAPAKLAEAEVAVGEISSAMPRGAGPAAHFLNRTSS